MVYRLRFVSDSSIGNPITDISRAISFYRDLKYKRNSILENLLNLNDKFIFNTSFHITILFEGHCARPNLIGNNRQS